MCSDTDKAIQTSPLVPQSSTSTVDSCVNKVSIVSETENGMIGDTSSSSEVLSNKITDTEECDTFNLEWLETESYSTSVENPVTVVKIDKEEQCTCDLPNEPVKMKDSSNGTISDKV